MKHLKTGLKRGKFDVLMSSRDCQAAKMTLRPGKASDDRPSNEHRRCEQWLLVLSGHGEAITCKKDAQQRAALAPGSLLWIEKGELHQIKNRGRASLVTMNFYVPPAYTEDGEPKNRNSLKQ